MGAKSMEGINSEKMVMADFHHISVLPTALVEGLAPKPGGHYLDATVGAGGHSEKLLKLGIPLSLTMIDRDTQAIAAAVERLEPLVADREDITINTWHGNFADFPGHPNQFDGIIADLGVSSPQLDQGDRGFSFRHTAPLDMRMDQSQELTAAEIINHWSEKDLARIFYEYGEERLSRRIARQIVEQRPFQTTTDLAEAIARWVPGKYRHGRIHPATRTFQGLRIAVNDELGSLETFIAQAPHWLKTGGRLGIISFHSLEDRIVKHRFRETENLRVLTKKPIIAGEEEQRENPRARSAKLRWAEKI
ncbi:16S rRNA (cytosine(1402)-N(4))-methyltransferase RsmH [Synechocystis salina LEGE 06099]|uniref:16S rRNA (cytosine(1402)-N(4))-methyltransferase RsmH n=1 Tax=Synechocystis salina TaxID=945780 RepID=UPI0018815FE3|nr:16S rRNA (cytosine(1402)-N(4))-methyltransferase RsmH [Synechocystis salina]MBE9202846.1 16S rRNA (cytosine(1402)-N(4))-methyltransferase RsmH [Synechocystis salina LEGE 06099]